MMNKGFTLIEMLGIIILLAVIALITVPVINSSLNKSRENLKVTQEKQFVKAAKDFFSQNLSCLPDGSGTCSDASKNENSSKVLLSKLSELGYVDGEIKDPVTNKEYNESAGVTVTKENNKYTYIFEE